MDALLDVWSRIWDDITSGRHAPVAFRFILQPVMAAFLAWRAGRQDARDGRPLYLWALVKDPVQRAALLREGWGHIGRVFILALVMDAIYQFISVRWFYPGEALMVSLILAVLPYLVFRSVVNRILRRSKQHG
jgi:hypothetical protein